MARILIRDINETPEQFQEIHGKGLFLGGSEIATAAGLNKFSTPLQLWFRKTGRDTSVIDNKHTRLGKKMEQVVAETFLEEMPQYKIAKKINSTYQHDTIDWATCTPDYVLSDVDYGVDLWKEHANTLLEIKTSGIWADKEWSEGLVPDYAQIQLMWQMGICGVERGYLAALIGGKNFYSKEIAFNKDVFAQLVELGDRFLDYVRSDKPPSATYADDLSYIRPTDAAIDLTATDSIQMAMQFELLQKEVSELNAQIKLKEQTKDTIKNKFIQLMGTAGKASCGDYEIVRKEIAIKESVRKGYNQLRFSIKNKKDKE